MLIIGFTGPAGCGKDTAALALVRQLGFVRFSFAAPIKDALNGIFGWSDGDWQNREWKEENLPDIDASPRRLAQTLGTEWARDIVHPNFWVLVLKHRLRRLSESGQRCNLVTISDVRFPNEAEWIRDVGGYVVDVTRNLETKVQAHSSEIQLDPELIDFILPNKGGVKTLELEAIELVSRIMKDAPL